jgi:hypothetical protein
MTKIEELQARKDLLAKEIEALLNKPGWPATRWTPEEYRAMESYMAQWARPR